MFLIDVSQSDYFGTTNQFKNEMMTEIAAVLSFSAIQNNDKVGLLLFTDKVETYIPPKKGKQHILRIIRELLDFKPHSNGTDIQNALRHFNNMMKKRSITFLMSYFIDQNYEKALNIVGRRHDLIGINIYDIREKELPSVGMVRFRDPETSKLKWIDTSSHNVRKLFSNWHEEHMIDLKQTFIRSKADLISIRTDEPYTTSLLNFFKNRGKRR